MFDLGIFAASAVNSFLNTLDGIDNAGRRLASEVSIFSLSFTYLTISWDTHCVRTPNKTIVNGLIL